MLGKRASDVNSKKTMRKRILVLFLIILIVFASLYIYFFERPYKDIRIFSVDELVLNEKELEMKISSSQYNGKLIPLDIILSYGENKEYTRDLKNGIYKFSLAGYGEIIVEVDSKWISIDGDKKRFSAPVKEYDGIRYIGKLTDIDGNEGEVRKYASVKSVLVPGELFTELYGDRGVEFKKGIITIPIENSASKGNELIAFKKYDGNLILGNRDYPLPREYEPTDLADIKNSQANIVIKSDNSYLKQDALTALEQMSKDAPSELTVRDAYRSYAEQENVLEDFIASQQKKYKRTRNTALKRARDKIAMPGTSDHQTGLSLDFNRKYTPMFWLDENAYKYGYIFRYTKEQAVDYDVPFEPTHYRYVGLPHSEYIKEKKYTLEKYYDVLALLHHYTYSSVDGNKYSVIYLEGSLVPKEIKTIKGSKNNVSDSNLGGVLVTYIKK